MKFVLRYIRICPHFLTNEKNYHHTSLINNKMSLETKSLCQRCPHLALPDPTSFWPKVPYALGTGFSSVFEALWVVCLRWDFNDNSKDKSNKRGRGDGK